MLMSMMLSVTCDYSLQVLRKDTDQEPVFFSTLPRTFYSALLNGYTVKTVLDLTPGNGAFAEACLVKRCGHVKVGYFGVCMTETHMNAIRERLEFFVLKQMMMEGTLLYVPRCVEVLQPKPAETQKKVQKGNDEKDTKRKNVSGGKGERNNLRMAASSRSSRTRRPPPGT